MPFLGQIISLINSGIQAKLTDKRFSGADYNGIAIPIQSETNGAKQVMPCIYQSAGQSKYVGIDDKFPLIIYHKLLRNASQPAPAASQFGDGQKTLISQAILNLIAYADRSKIDMAPDDLEALITAGMADEIPKADYPSNGFVSIVATPVETSFNQSAIFSQEYQGVDFFLKPESILFQLTYKVVSTYRKDCLPACGCT